MVVEPVSERTPRPVRRAVMTQWWRDVTFLHWTVEPDAVAALLPPGTRPDLFDGRAYVGLVPFRMERTLRLPYLGSFCETNVRLYSVDERGRRGVVFLSLDAARLIPALAGRAAVSLPYLWSALRIEKTSGTVEYRCRRRRGDIGSRVRVRPGEPIAEPTPLEQFLTARWGLHVARGGRTLYMPNEHPAWPLHRAELLDCDDDLVAAAGVPVTGEGPVSVLYSPGVPVRFGPPFRADRPIERRGDGSADQ
ncbi:YqjF family protein [Nocardia sp. NPDC003693]